MGNKNMPQKRALLDRSRLAVVYHPGETLEEKLQEMGMGVKEFATRVSKPEKTIIAVMKGKSSITPDMAVSFELVTKIPAHMWLNSQRSYDEYVARKKREASLKDGIIWAKKFPLEEISRLGWLSEHAMLGGQQKDIVETLCSFFGVSSPKGWEDFYLNQRLRVVFRITLSEVCDPYALSAWLRQGEIQAGEIELTNNYSAKRLRDTLVPLSEMRKHESKNPQLSPAMILGNAGVKLVFTDTLSTAPVKGCTRYIYGVPVIQMAKKFNNDSDFWHTLFHEIGHILLHGKKDIFMENVDYGDKDPEKEQEADDFAKTWMSK